MPDTIIGASLTLTADQANKTLKDFKQELKTANAELLTMVERFGATSKEAQAAAKKVAELKDVMADNKTLVDAFNPDRKFNALAQSVTAVTGGFAALQGVMGLVGSESESLQRSLLKVQSALAISQGLDSIRDSIASVKTLGAQLVANLGKNGLIGVAIAGVAVFTAAILGAFDGMGKMSQAQKELNASLKDYQRAASDARVKVIEVSNAFELARAGLISKEEALKTYNDTLGDSLGRTNDLATAEKNLADKAETYIKITGLKAQANALFAKAAQTSAQALIDEAKLAKEIEEGGTRGLMLENFGGILRKRIEQSKKDAKEIEDIGANLLRQAALLSKQSGVTLNPSGSSSPNPKVIKDIEDQIVGIKDASATAQELINERLKGLSDDYIDKELERLSAEEKATEKRNSFITRGMDLSKNAASEIIKANQEIIQSNIDAANNAETTAKARVTAAQAVANALGAVAELIGRQTAAGKVLGIAQATINTWIGVTEVLRAKTILPEPFGTIAKIANVTAIIASGLNAVKNITKVNVGSGGGSSGGGVGDFSVPAPLRPQLQVGTTQLDQNSLNSIGNATFRAYVVEADVANNRERLTRLSRQARLGG